MGYRNDILAPAKPNLLVVTPLSVPDVSDVCYNFDQGYKYCPYLIVYYKSFVR